MFQASRYVTLWVPMLIRFILAVIVVVIVSSLCLSDGFLHHYTVIASRYRQEISFYSLLRRHHHHRHDHNDRHWLYGCFLQDTYPSRIVKNVWKLYESQSSRTMRQQTAIANPEPLKTQSNTHILDLSPSTSWATKKPNISRHDFERNISPQILSNISSTSSICWSQCHFWAQGHGDLCLPTDVPARRFWSHAPRKENPQLQGMQWLLHHLRDALERIFKKSCSDDDDDDDGMIWDYRIVSYFDVARLIGQVSRFLWHYAKVRNSWLFMDVYIRNPPKAQVSNMAIQHGRNFRAFIRPTTPSACGTHEAHRAQKCFQKKPNFHTNSTPPRTYKTALWEKKRPSQKEIYK